jgi:hypothetical protein
VKVKVEITRGGNSIASRREQRTDTTVEVDRADRDEAFVAAITTLYLLGGPSLQRYIETRMDLVRAITAAWRGDMRPLNQDSVCVPVVGAGGIEMFVPTSGARIQDEYEAVVAEFNGVSWVVPETGKLKTGQDDDDEEESDDEDEQF